MTFFESRQMGHRRHCYAWAVTEKTIGQKEQFFGIELLGAGRLGDRIGESIIYLAHTCCIRVAEPGNLYRSRFISHCVNSGASCVAGQVYEDVYFVIFN